MKIVKKRSVLLVGMALLFACSTMTKSKEDISPKESKTPIEESSAPEISEKTEEKPAVMSERVEEEKPAEEVTPSEAEKAPVTPKKVEEKAIKKVEIEKVEIEKVEIEKVEIEKETIEPTEKQKVEAVKKQPEIIQKEEGEKPSYGVADGVTTVSDVPDTAEDGSIIHKIIMPDQKAAGSSQFKPVIIRIKVGESIAWINEDERTHYINTRSEYPGFSAFSSYDEDEDEEEERIENGSLKFNSPVLKKGDKWIHKITKKGTINYYCFTHPLEMVGKIIVE